MAVSTLVQLVTSVIGDLGVNFKPLVVLTLWIKCTVHRNQTKAPMPETPGVPPSGDVCRGTKKIRSVCRASSQASKGVLFLNGPYVTGWWQL